MQILQGSLELLLNRSQMIIRVLIASALIWLSVFVDVAAQSIRRADVYAGVVFGQSKFGGDGVSIPRFGCPLDGRNGKFNYSPSATIGVTLEAGLSRKLNLAMDLGYFSSIKKSEQCLEDQFRNHWITFSLLPKFYTSTGSFRVFFGLGPRLRYLLDDEYNVVRSPNIQVGSWKDRFSFDLTSSAGLEYGQFAVEVVLSYNMLSPVRSYIPYAGEDTQHTNRDIFLSTILKYNLIRAQGN